MYSWEIDILIKSNNYQITPNEYQKIVTESPQINNIKYEPFNNKFVISTTDNYYWMFAIKK